MDTLFTIGDQSVHFLLVISFFLEELCSAIALPNIWVEWSLLEASSLHE